MTSQVLMLDLVRTFYWFDEQLQIGLDAQGWGRMGRTQSLILANIANGETRASRMAEKLGISRQAMSQFLAELEERKLVEIVQDEADKRARIVRFTKESESIRKDAILILSKIEARMREVIGPEDFEAMRNGLRMFIEHQDF